MKKNEIVKYYLYNSLKALLFALLFTLILGYVLGYRAKLVKSGSSEPDIRTHSIVITANVDPTTLKVGDYITFEIQKTFITHRITDVDLENKLVYCSDNQIDKDTGKYNMEHKQLVHYNEIIGKVIYTNYIIGETAFTIKNNSWILVGLLSCIMLLLVIKDQTTTEPSF